MQVTVLFFGQLTDITEESQIVMYDIPDTDSLLVLLQNKFPALEESKFIIALDKQIISTNTNLDVDCTVALLPPYSGG